MLCNINKQINENEGFSIFEGNLCISAIGFKKGFYPIPLFRIYSTQKV
jgi:hypothetical protein